MEQTVTSAIGGPLGNDPSGYRVVTVAEKEITNDYVSITESTDVENIKFVTN